MKGYTAHINNISNLEKRHNEEIKN